MLRIVVTGGGTGGHVYPALEVARVASEAGSEILYLGSLRGMEGEACRQRGILFQGFASEPVYNYRSIAGIRALANLLRLSGQAKEALKAARPDVIFSTGGYSSAPVMQAAKRLGLPLVIHCCDTVPGRALRMFSKYATTVTSTFNGTKDHLDREVVRTGQPIRNELRTAVSQRQPQENLVVILGGSGGAKFLNDTVPLAARLLPDVRFIHSAGVKQYEAALPLVEGIEDRYELKPYLESEDMARAYQTATLAIARSGATISEFAMARIPSILIPLPTSADDHQHHNAKEFEAFGGASLLTQDIREGEVQANEVTLAKAIEEWLGNSVLRSNAEKSLAKWDAPDATNQIWTCVQEVAKKNHA